MISNNIISQFGYGDSAWMWKEATRAVIRFDRGQEPSDPPLRDMLITGNVISNPDKDEHPTESAESDESPRYHCAVLIEKGTDNSPRGLHFGLNLFPVGTTGLSNIELPQ